jgi:hypothetical protein
LTLTSGQTFAYCAFSDSHFSSPGPGSRLDRIDRTFRLARPAIDAFVRLDDEHVLALVEAVHGGHLDAVHRFAANAVLVNNVGQLGVLSADRSGVLIHGFLAVQAAQAELQKQHPKRGRCPGDPLQAFKTVAFPVLFRVTVLFKRRSVAFGKSPCQAGVASIWV